MSETMTEQARAYYTDGLVEATLEHEFDEEVGPLVVVVSAWYRPGRPVRRAAPGSSAYSEDGAPAEFEVERVALPGGGELGRCTWDTDEFLDAVGRKLAEDRQEARDER